MANRKNKRRNKRSMQEGRAASKKQGVVTRSCFAAGRKRATVSAAAAADKGTEDGKELVLLILALPVSCRLNILNLLMMIDLPACCRIKILNILGNSDLMNAAITCKGLRDDCRRPGITNTIVPIIEIKVKSHQLREFAHNLNHKLYHLRLEWGEHKFRRCSHMIVQYDDEMHLFRGNLNEILQEHFLYNSCLDGVFSLKVSFPNSIPNSNGSAWYNFAVVLKFILPNLRELDLLNASNHYGSIERFLRVWPSMEKIRCDATTTSFIDATGLDLGNAGNLKEMYLDDSLFRYSTHPLRARELSDVRSSRNATAIIFKNNIQTLECVSIRNAKWCSHASNSPIVPIPQNALIKFVRNCPNLRWFRSDLAKDNMDQLRLERPGILLCN